MGSAGVLPGTLPEVEVFMCLRGETVSFVRQALRDLKQASQAGISALFFRLPATQAHAVRKERRSASGLAHPMGRRHPSSVF